MEVTTKSGYECPRCKNNYSTAYSMYRHMRKVHNLDINRCVTLYCPIENCNESYDRYNALDTHLTHVHYADIRKETFEFSDLNDFEAWLRDITSSSKTKYIKRSCNNSYRYYRCHRSGLPKTSTERLNTMKSSVKIGRHCPSRIIAKITDRNVSVEFVPTHIGHECEVAKIPLSHKKRLDIACRLSASNNSHCITPPDIAGIAVISDSGESHNSPMSQALQASETQNHNQHRQQQGQQQTMINTLIGQRDQSANMNVTSIPNSQTTTSNIIQSDERLTDPLTHMKDHQMTLTMNQASPSLLQPPIPSVTRLSINDNLSMMPVSPNKQELKSRFEQLLDSIRSDKHASIVKAQLEVCFALIRD